VEGAAAATVMARFFNTDFISFSMTSGAPYPGITRKFWSFRRFVEAFYDALASGARVGDATLEGQRKLKDDTFRGRAMAIEVNDVIWLARASGAVEFLAQVLSPPTLPHRAPLRDCCASRQRRTQHGEHIHIDCARLPRAGCTEDRRA
jgi:hypothetical protein